MHVPLVSRRLRWCARLLLISLVGSLATAWGATLPRFDFQVAGEVAAWTPTHHLDEPASTAEGMRLTLRGHDPYLFGPPRDYPAGQPLWLHLRLKSDQGGMAQVFYYPADRHATEEHSVRFTVRGGGEWNEVKVRLPALGPQHRLRLDPPGSGGVCVVERLWCTERTQFTAPAWPRPAVPELGDGPVAIESGDLKVVHSRQRFGAFRVEVAGQAMAMGHAEPWVGYVRNGAPRWFAVNGESANVVVSGQPLSRLADAQVGGYLRTRVSCTDPDGGRWQLELTFRLNTAGALEFESVARCDQEREVLYLPLVTLLPGLGSYGTNKTQALLAGVEYLENEPSSSTADLNPPGSDRQVADTAKLTFPLMAVAAQERYLGLAWNQPPGAPTCAVFDSPDRMFNSGAHLMGLLVPGSDGSNREENSLLPYDTLRLRADQRVGVSGLLLGGRGSTVVPAVQEYVRRYGLPPLPAVPGGTEGYLELAARGWLDSDIRDGTRYRHAAPGFPSQPAADAALYQDWLATRVSDAALAERLEAAARAAIEQVPAARLNQAQVGHVRYPAPALVYGSVPAQLARAEENGRALLKRFAADGVVRYQKSPNGLDYGRTHWASDANGLTAQVLGAILDEALFSGDPGLIEAGLRHLRALTERYRGGVPRGAQTWEIALHTPDILAAAYLVHCYVLGYELSGDPAWLEEARYWAWSGVPFVYLSAPTSEPIGLYATTPVLGATQWVAPNWIGLPVQWCGLVYAEALYRLARHDASGPWTQLADGIAVSGIQQTYPATVPRSVGLLPDSFSLRGQTRNPADINPATLLAPALRALQQPLVYDTRALRHAGLRVHAPGELDQIEEGPERARFRVRGWSKHPYFVVVNGLRQAPQLRVDGRPTALESPHEYQAAARRLILRLEGVATVELALAGFTFLEGPVNGVILERAGRRLAVYGDPTGEQTGVDTVLLTHARRDVTWAAQRGADAGAKVVAPAKEEGLLARPTEFWDAWRQQRFHDYAQQSSKWPAHAFPVSRTVQGGDSFEWEGLRFHVLDTPGYTRGSVSYWVELEGQKVAFTGDLIRDDGRLQDLFSLQDAIPGARVGGYHGWAGRLGAWVESLNALAAAKPDLLVPARGPVIRDPAAAMARALGRVRAVYANYLSIDALRWYFKDEHILAKARRVLGPDARVDWMPMAETRPLPDWIRAISNSRLLLAKSGAGLLIDCGGKGIVEELRKLHAAGSLQSVEQAFITHYHDDHTDALPLLVEAFGTQIHACGSLIDVLERPGDYRLPCLTRNPIRVTAPHADRDTWRWEEFRLTIFDFPGQTLHHNGLLVEREGSDAFFFAGDSFTPSGVDDYCLQNRNWLGEGRGYLRCLEVVEMLPAGCWLINQHVDPAFRFVPDQIQRMRRTLQERRVLLADLVPFDDPNFGLDEGWAVLHPYAVERPAGQAVRFELRLTNHSPQPRTYRTQVQAPAGWTVAVGDATRIGARTDGVIPITVSVPAGTEPGLRVITADVAWEGGELRAWVEGLVEVKSSP